jgi:hypothetical protein
MQGWKIPQVQHYLKVLGGTLKKFADDSYRLMGVRSRPCSRTHILACLLSSQNIGNAAARDKTSHALRSNDVKSNKNRKLKPSVGTLVASNEAFAMVRSPVSASQREADVEISRDLERLIGDQQSVLSLFIDQTDLLSSVGSQLPAAHNLINVFAESGVVHAAAFSPSSSDALSAASTDPLVQKQRISGDDDLGTVAKFGRFRRDSSEK